MRDRLGEAGLDTIFLLSPTTTTERIRRAAALGSGFLYGISRLGVTGARATSRRARKPWSRASGPRRRCRSRVGFGISHPAHVAEVGRWADAAVVGSALVAVIAQHGASPALVSSVMSYVQWLKGEGRPSPIGPGEPAS